MNKNKSRNGKGDSIKQVYYLIDAADLINRLIDCELMMSSRSDCMIDDERYPFPPYNAYIYTHKHEHKHDHSKKRKRERERYI